MATFSFGFDLPSAAAGGGGFDGPDGDVSMDTEPCTDVSTGLSSQAPAGASPADLLHGGPEDTQFPAVHVGCPASVALAVSPGQPYRAAYTDIMFSRSANTAPLLPVRKVDLEQHPERVHSVNIPTNHDIVPSTYGGGYKTWECSVDLAQYLLHLHPPHVPTNNTVDRGPALLELGCGHGLPGIAALRYLGYRAAVFNDLNSEVLHDTTWPNLALNGLVSPATAAAAAATAATAAAAAGTGAAGVEPDVQCVGGHWNSVSTALGSQTFELVLSAETAYSEVNVRTIMTMLRRHLKRDGGKAYLATKRFYFGLSGGTLCIETEAAAAGLACRVVHSIEDGASNIRDILMLTHVGEMLS